MKDRRWHMMCYETRRVLFGYAVISDWLNASGQVAKVRDVYEAQKICIAHNADIKEMEAEIERLQADNARMRRLLKLVR